MFAVFEMGGIVVIELLALIFGVLLCILLAGSLKGTRLNGNPNTSVGEDFRLEAQRWREQPLKSFLKTGCLLAVAAMFVYVAIR